MSEHLRQQATVERVSYGPDDHGCLTCWLHLSFGGSVQGFGGLALDEKLGPDFAAALCALFGVPFESPDSLNQLIGRRCWALRCFDENNTPIEGLEVIWNLGLKAEHAQRFTLTGWRRKHFPETLDVLTAETHRIEREIAWAKRRLAEEEERLRTARSRYHSWEP